MFFFTEIVLLSTLLIIHFYIFILIHKTTGQGETWIFLLIDWIKNIFILTKTLFFYFNKLLIRVHSFQMNFMSYKFSKNFYFRHRSSIALIIRSKMSTPNSPVNDHPPNNSPKISTALPSPTENMQNGNDFNSKSSQNPATTAEQQLVAEYRLAQFRALFAKLNAILGIEGTIDAYILPRTDAHNSEYICDRDLRVQFISGFSGSHGYAVITRKDALLWTDGRYYVQAKKELYEGWQMMKWQSDFPSPTDWIVQNMEADVGDKCLAIGFDPKLIEYEKATQMIEKFANFGIKSVPINTNLVDLIWPERPEEKIQKIIYLSVEECGEEPSSKLAKVREELKKQKCDGIILSQLDDICWLYNLRGFDIPFNPVFFSYAFVTSNGNAYLFVDLRKMTPEVASHLKKNSIEIFDYKDVGAFLKQWHEARIGGEYSGHKIWISQSTNYELGSLITKKNIYLAASPVQKMKVEKNDVELDGMRHGHIRDSAALVKFFYWLKNELDLGHLVTESRAARQAKYYREQQDKFVSLSFETISAADEHAALPHYHPDEESGMKLITKDGIYLLDSGGQYRDATTDVTRTVCFADQPDPHFRQMFTLVLKAHLDLATTKFPAGTSDSQLDGITRAALWRAGYDFGHGTGHGVGHFLNVHEIPPFIGHRLTFNFALQKGAVVTIEPGYYEEGKFGIRIENCYELVQAKGLASGATNYLAFAPLTLVPIQKNLIIREQLEEKHIDWLNRYHNACLESVGRYLQEKGMQDEYNFLAEACTPF